MAQVPHSVRKCHKKIRAHLALGVLVFVGLLEGAYAQGERPAAGRVKVLSGTASAERLGQTRPLKPGDAIFEADHLRTGPDGRIGITLKDGIRLSLGPNTDVALTTFAYAPVERQFGLVLRVARGILEYVSCRLGKLAPESIRIETPSSIVGVRGTHLLIEVPER
jgi:hypothetical protein